MKKHLLPFLALLIFAAHTSSNAQTVTLWGMTSAGGGATTGTLFSFNSSIGLDTVVHSFGRNYDGTDATGSPLNVGGVLYGMTQLSGAYGSGTIYSYNIATGVYNDVHDFGNDTDGQIPVIGSLILSNNSLLYGVTSLGGANDSGTLFSFNMSTNTETILHDFTGADGYQPIGSLTQVHDSLLFGMAVLGGANSDGVIFKYNILTGKETDVHDFAGGYYDGAYPGLGFLQVGDSLLYGMTTEGGAHGYGIIFTYDFLNGYESNKYAFHGNTTDGGAPYGIFTQVNDSLLYGLNGEGGLNYSGTIFTFNILRNTETDVYNFGSGTDGVEPINSLLLASNHLLYGTTELGGANNHGTIFSYNDTTGVESVIHSFGTDTDGKAPEGNLIEVDVIHETPISDTICAGDSVTLYNIAAAPAPSVWTPATGLSSTIGDSVFASPKQTTVYLETGVINNTLLAIRIDTVFVNPQPPKPTINIENKNTLISSATSGNQWYMYGTLIPGATQQTYIPDSDGVYIVVVTDSVTGCSSIPDSFPYFPGGIKQLTLQNSIKTFPNPFNTSITLNINSSAGDLENWYLQITDVLGRTVYTKQSLNYNNDIDLSNLPGGMYFINVMNNTDRAVIPVVKQ